MLRKLTVTHEAWPLATPFRISRVVKTIADVVVVEISEGSVRGRGEGVPYPRYGESVSTVLEEIHALQRALAEGLTREDLQYRIPAGAARNAIDCALWDLEARLTGQSVTEQLGYGSVPPLPSALTIGIDTPDAEKLLAATHDLEGMRQFIGADSLAFLSVDGIYRSIGLEGRDARSPQFTDHCFTGDYPTELTDQNGEGAPRQLSLLAEVG